MPLQYATVEGHRIAYLDIGQGPPLMLIHGFGGSIWNWEHQVHELATRHRIIVMDLLGSGRSDKPAVAYTPSRMVQFFFSFMNVLGVERATLIGNSMGAGLAMAIALDYPDRVTRLILIAGFPPDPYRSIASKRYRRFLDHRPPLWLGVISNRLAGRGVTRAMLEEIIHDRTLITPLVIERSFHNRRIPGFLPPLYSLVDHIQDWTKTYGQRLHEIAVPTLLLWGSHDRVLPYRVGMDLHRLIPQSRLHAVPEAGHMPQWEKPAFVNRLILEFLENHAT
ncbi:MAG: alpha/beta fold hydrolase [Nitrospirae bacterium]|nr:MAG: alpha/beta fold hydrolase [Nitrospirota bacterium]